MATMNISLPETLKSFVDAQVSDRGYGTSSEYVRDLIREDAQRERFRALIREGFESPIVGEADDAYFDRLRADIRGRL